MILAISQPTLYPWIGFFDIIEKSDIFVFLDDVQFNRHGWQQNNRIKDPKSDEEVWLNIPIKKANLENNINEIKIDNSKKWKRKHVRALETCYGTNFKGMDWLVNLYSKEWENLSSFNIEFIEKCCKYLEIDTKLICSSTLNVSGKRTEKLVNICKIFSADSYLSTIGTKENYLEEVEYMFKDVGIKVMYHDYLHPTYSQRGKKFLDHLSILDLILNLGNESKKIFR